MPSGGSRCATGRDDIVPLINSKVPAWIPPSAIKREALTTNTDSDDEELFRQVRGLLNKLTPEKFEKLSVEFCNLSIKNPKALKGIIVLILDKALSESAYSALYAQLCQRLDKWVPNFEPPNANNHQNSITTFRKLLLTVCQHEFDNRSNYTSILLTNQNESKLDSPISLENYSDDEKKAQLELARQNAKKKMLGNVKFIGELGRLDLLSEAILHKCIKTLLEKQRDEKYSDMSEDLECLCKMMPTIGSKLDQGEAIKLMDQYFERMKKLCAIKTADKTEYALPMRNRFMLLDLIELRAKQWQPRKTQVDQAPKTMHEVRNGAFMEEMAAAALAASSREAQDAAAQACFNISSLNLSSNSALMMNMYQKLSQQPNMSLLNAINTKIATNKSNNMAQQQTIKNKQIYNNEYLISNSSEPIQGTNDVECEASKEIQAAPISNSEMNLVTRQNTTKQNCIKQLEHNQSEQTTNPQKTTFSFHQRNTQKSQGYNSLNNNSSQMPTDQQKLQLQYKNKNFSKNQLIDSAGNFDQQKRFKNPVNNVKKTANFNWNQLQSGTNTILTTATAPSHVSNTVTEVPTQQIPQLKTQINMQSISSSSSPFSSTSSLSASPPLPILNDSTANSNMTNSNSKPTDQANIKPNSQNSVTLTSNASSSSSSSSSTTSNQVDSGYSNTNSQNRINTGNQYIRNFNSMANGYVNNYNGPKRQSGGQQFMGKQQRALFYPNSNHNTARNALGVSTNDVLPLNKPIIPLNKVTKYEHNNHYNNKNVKPKPALNIFNTNIYNLATQNTAVVKTQKKVNNLILDEGTKQKLLNTIDKYLNEKNKDEENNVEYSESIVNDCLNEFKEFKLTNEKLSEAIRMLITDSLSRSDTDRLELSRLFIRLHATEIESGVLMSSETFVNGLKVILQNLSNLESEYHCVKSNISMFAARAVCNTIMTFDELGAIMKHGAHYPLFFLCMQNMHKLKTKEWMRAELEKSKINLLEMLPSSDRYKDRLIQILEDRELSFVYPMLKIESALLEKIQSNSLTNEKLKEWIETNVSMNVTNSNDFIHSLVTCVVKNAAEKSVLSTENSDLNSKMDKSHVNKQKQLIQQYQRTLQDYLCEPKSKLNKQIEAIYAMQVYANSKGFPKYFLAHLFNQMYDLEIIEEEAFLQWKDEINESYPNKGQALFYLQRWFNWLQEASEESSGSETEALGEKLPKTNGIKENNEQIEV